MAERDEFDLTRGGEEDEHKAPVLSLRRRGRPNPRPGNQPQNGAHRHLAARVRVPLTTPAETRTPTLGWNQEPDAPGPAPQPAPQVDPQARSTPKRSTRTPHRAIALATLALTALISAAALIITRDLTSSGARTPHAHAATAPTDNAALLPALTLTGQALAGDIDKLASRDGKPAHAQRAAARKYHVAARHSAPPPPTYVAAGAHNSSRVSQSAGLADRAAQTPTAPSDYHPAANGPTSSQPVASQPVASQPAVSRPAVSQPAASQPAGPTGFGHVIGSSCNPQCR